MGDSRKLLTALLGWASLILCVIGDLFVTGTWPVIC